jgi:hypothetical protein
MPALSIAHARRMRARDSVVRGTHPIIFAIADQIIAERIREVDVELARNPLFEEWSILDQGHEPAPSVLAEAVHHGGLDLCLQLVRRLAGEKKLRAYAQGDNFARLVMLYTQAEILRGEVA